jgi:Domain of unknown function (DUF4410)
MNARSLVFALLLSAAMTSSIAAPRVPAAAAAPNAAQSPSGDQFPNKSITIYVADFDLDFARLAGTPSPPGNPTSRPVPPASNGAANSGVSGTSAGPSAPQQQSSAVTPASSAGSRTAQPDGARADATHTDAPADGSRSDGSRADGSKPEVIQEDSPRAQAARLIDLTSRTLVKVLEQQGYAVRRMHGIATQPDRGIIIRGVFAQLDETKTLRRTVIGGAVTNPNMLIYVGIGNLSKPEQTMYTVVAPPTADNVGPAISLSVYAPIGRYEVERDPSEESVKLFANGVAADLTRLLNANSLALQQ